MDLISAVQTATKIRAFVEQGGLAKAIQEVGGNELNAAIVVLNNLKYASQYREAVNRALTHLESAHQHFRKIELESVGFFRPDIQAENSHKDFLTCCLIAICHKYLGDDTELVKKALQRAYYAIWPDDSDEERKNHPGGGFSVELGAFIATAIFTAGLGLLANPYFHKGQKLRDSFLEQYYNDGKFEEFKKLLLK